MKHDWEYKKLGELGRVVTGSTPSTKDTKNYETNDVCFIKPSDISGNGINYLKDSEYYISEYAYNNSRQLPKGSVLTTCIGIIGKVAILEIDATCNQQINAIVPNNDVDSKFLAYSIISQRYLMQSMANAPVVPLLNKTQFSGFSIPLPPLSTQQSIVSELDSLSKIIADCKETLKDYDALEQSIFYDMFGDPVKNDKGWDVKKLGEVCESIVRGPFGSALKKEFFVQKSETTYKVYEQKHAIHKDHTIGSYYISQEKYNELKRFEVSAEDIIMSCSGTIGELYQIPQNAERGVMNQALLKFHLANNIKAPFFLFLMPILKNSMSIHGCGLQNIGSVKIIKDLEFGLPNIEIQKTFLSKIEAIEQMKSETKKALQEAETLFNARMDYWFN